MSAILSVSDKQSATWLRIKDHLERRIATLRMNNDNEASEIETARLRGRIAELKHLLNIDADEPAIQEHLPG